MKFRTLVLAVVLSLSAVTNCQVYSDISTFADVKVKEYNVEPSKTNSDVDVVDREEDDYVLEPIEVSDLGVVNEDYNEQEPLIFANAYDDYSQLQLPSEKVDVVRAGLKVQDYDLNSVKAADDDGSQLAENLEANPIKLAYADVANIQSLVGDYKDKSLGLGLLTDWEIENTEGKDDVDLDAMRNWWNNLADSDDSESDESEDSDESESGEGDDSESDESDEDDGDKYGFNFKIPSFDIMAQWIQAVKQQQPIDTKAATLGDDMLGDDKHDYFAEISEADSTSSGSGASKQVEPSVDNDFDARVNPDGQVDSGYNKPTYDNKQQNPTNVEWANVEPELQEQKVDSQEVEKHNVVKSEGRPLHVYSAFHYVFFAISVTLFVLGLMVIVGAIIRNLRYKKPGYVIMVETGMSGKM